MTERNSISETTQDRNSTLFHFQHNQIPYVFSEYYSSDEYYRCSISHSSKNIQFIIEKKDDESTKQYEQSVDNSILGRKDQQMFQFFLNQKNSQIMLQNNIRSSIIDPSNKQQLPQFQWANISSEGGLSNRFSVDFRQYPYQQQIIDDNCLKKNQNTLQISQIYNLQQQKYKKSSISQISIQQIFAQIEKDEQLTQAQIFRQQKRYQYQTITSTLLKQLNGVQLDQLNKQQIDNIIKTQYLVIQ